MTVELSATARRAVLEQYAAAHDRHSEEEQLAKGERPIEAEGFHAYALRVLRAYRAELDDPRPEGLDR